MTVAAKICGLTDAAAVSAAVDNGAAYVGFVFYPPSPRNVSPEQAAELAANVPKTVRKVGLFVDPADELIQDVLDALSLDLIQLHGSETPERVRNIRGKFGLPVMKAIKIGEKSSVADGYSYYNVADMILFDAQERKEMENALPGGNGVVFDWLKIADIELSVPYMLAGGLTADNVAQAVRFTGAMIVDVSSGVESSPGKKDPEKIAAFIKAVKEI
ncbi:MAG: phosphoribosylanthranilate isomerase [Sneathiella sp.]